MISVLGLQFGVAGRFDASCPEVSYEPWLATLYALMTWIENQR